MPHIGQQFRRIFLTVVIAAAFFGAFFQLVTTHAQGVPLTVDVAASPTSVGPDEQATFTITLAAPDQNVAGAVLSLTVSGPVQDLTFTPVPSLSSGYSTTAVQRQGNTFRWRGGIQQGGQVVLRATATSATILDPDKEPVIAMTAHAGRLGNDQFISAVAQVETAIPAIIADDFTLEAAVFDKDGNPIAAQGDTISLLNGSPTTIRQSLANNGDKPAIGLLDLSRTSDTRVADATQVDTACSLSLMNNEVIEGPFKAFPVRGGDDTLSRFLIVIAPGDQVIVETTILPLGNRECSADLQLDTYLKALPASIDLDGIAPSRALVNRLLDQPPTLRQLLILAILAADFGDAPDSSNHFPGTNMTAYLAPVTIGRFPTVFDPTTGADQGPMHKWARPMVLGSQVSLELSADLYAGRNLDPLNDLADLDLRDDGINPAMLTLQHCMPTTIPFEATFTQAALDWLAAQEKTAYLNIWIDGNRDGDWGDVLDCDGIQAPEHIVIDQAVSPATAGRIALVAVTGNLPIPQENVGKDMWLRVTLSDEPSVKTGQVNSLGQVIQYGDGRGPAGGFTLGETEDYLVNPSGGGTSGRVPRLVIESDVTSIRDLDTGVAAAAGTRDRILLRSVIRSASGLPTTPKLIIESTPYLGMPETSARCCPCLTCTVAAVQTSPLVVDAATVTQLPFEEVCDGGKCHLELALDDLSANGSLDLLAAWSWDAVGGDEVELSIRSKDETSLGDIIVTKAFRPIAPLRIVFPPSGSFSRPITETIASTAGSPSADRLGNFEIQMIVQGEPGRTFMVEISGVNAGFYTLDAQGIAKPTITLPNGANRIRARYPVDSVSAAWDAKPGAMFIDKSSPYLALLVRDDLPFNPGSLTAGFPRPITETIALGRGLPLLDASGYAAAEGWILPYIEQQNLTFGVDLTCSEPDAAAHLALPWLAQPLSLEKKSPTGRHEATFFVPDIGDEVVIGLVVRCDGVETTFAGRMLQVAPSTVVDGADKAPIEGAEVTLWNLVRDANGSQAVPWPAELFGQENPQTTDAAGHFLFVPGVTHDAEFERWALSIVKEGYSPRKRPGRAFLAIPPTIFELRARTGNDVAVEDLSLTGDGFATGTLRIMPGDNVRVRNLGLNFASFEASAVATSIAQRIDSSGLIAPGDSYDIRFMTEGTYTLVNGEDPSQIVTILVDGSSPNGPSLFLPLTAR